MKIGEYNQMMSYLTRPEPETVVIPEPKPQELLDLQEQKRKERLKKLMQELEPVLMDESVDFIERQNFAKKAIVKKRPDLGEYGEIDGRTIAAEQRSGKLRIPLTSEQKEILEDVYKVKTFEAAKKKYGKRQAFFIINRIRSGQVYKGMKSPIVQGFGMGASIPTEQSPQAKKIITAALNKLKVMKNKRAFFDFKEGDQWYKKLQKDLGDLSREPLNRAIKTIAQEEFPNSYIGKEGRIRYRREMVIKTFIDSLEVNKGFTGNEKFLPVLKEFRGTGMHVFEQINKDFKAWAKGEFEVDGVDRSKLTPKQLKDIKDYKPNQKQIRSVNKEQQLKWMHGANDRFKNLSAREVEQKFFRKFPKAPKNAFLQRSNELVQIKRTGSVISGADSTIEYPWAKIEPDNKSRWLKESYGKQFGGNYESILRRADQFRQAGNIDDAIRLEKAADKYFGPKGIFRKATGEGEHPFSRIMGGADQELKINSLVRGDLNQFKRVNFDTPVIQLLNKYSLTKPDSVARQKIIDEIEDRKKLMNLLTETKSEKGIVDVVKFNYGKTKIGPSTQVVPIDKLDEAGKFNVEDFVVRGENYLKGFEAASEKAPVLMQDGKITTKKFKGKELRDLIAAIACPGKAMGGRVGFQDGTSCFEKGKKMINTGKIPEGAGKRNFIKFANKAVEIGKQSYRGLRTIGKFGVIPEAIFIGADTLLRTGMGDTLDEAFKRATDLYRTDKSYEQADKLEILRRDPANVDLILNLRKFKSEQDKLSSLEQQKEADLALAGNEFDEFSIGETEEEIEKRYAPLLQKQENNLFNATISDAEERAGLRAETEFADKKGVAYKKSPVGAYFDYLAEKPGFKEITDLFATEARGEPDVSAQVLRNYFSDLESDEEKNLQNIIKQGKAKQVLDALKKIQAEEPVSVDEPNVFDEERKILFDLAKTDTALAERLGGANMTFFGDPINRTDLQDEMNLDRGIYALGGRIGFADGPKDPNRRMFMKIMAGIMSIPIVGKFLKPTAKVVPVVQDGVKLGIDKLMLLINKIQKFGTDVTPKLGTKERERVITYEGKDGSQYDLYEDLSTGDIRVERNKTGVGSSGDKTYDTIEDKSTFEIRKGEEFVKDEGLDTQKVIKADDEYEEGKAVFDQDGTVADYDEVDDSTIKAIEDEIN